MLKIALGNNVLQKLKKIKKLNFMDALEKVVLIQ